MYRLIALGLGYLLGGIQTAILYGRLQGIEIREHGSGNAGATNTLRVLGKKAALIVFIGDVLKAAAAVMIAKLLFPDTSLLAGLYAGIGAIIGHSYPLFFKFKGGKGIAVTVGTIYFIDIRIALIVSLIFIISAWTTRIVSSSSLLLTGFIPILLYVFYKGSPNIVEIVCLGVVIAGITAYRHKENIARLLNGTESKLGSKK
ncbi:glycerol-3-phosphate 1-O-acyltransferase PlsY [Niameybacter massiliensis]|uniref:Glycerol-3-phosphate acyltransferase n=1 Tax=Holtiella tumoricola TaxID=3018743 RepID=A0AA42J1I0_9FIRM|nr:glycerol-3-phosphate 1-O-acyltransferase PlsY [Holtiella tumoricola]MDA3732557.1 glycerol-3-phosphate 1-O-acyltransferase PlsY [Holtiella tumoricola]